MKKLFLLILLTASFAFTADKEVSASMSPYQWGVYNRNIDRLKVMGGRKGVDADLLLSTIDTINFFQYQIILPQLQKQLADTTKK